jgi:hypothetical protein
MGGEWRCPQPCRFAGAVRAARGAERNAGGGGFGRPGPDRAGSGCGRDRQHGAAAPILCGRGRFGAGAVGGVWPVVHTAAARAGPGPGPPRSAARWRRAPPMAPGPTTWRLGPSVVVVEDVHWADEATLDVIRLAGRRVGDVPTLLVLSYRDDGLDRSHPLRIGLACLSPRAVAELAGPAGVDTGELHRWTAGNPFFVSPQTRPLLPLGDRSRLARRNPARGWRPVIVVGMPARAAVPCPGEPVPPQTGLPAVRRRRSDHLTPRASPISPLPVTGPGKDHAERCRLLRLDGRRRD